MKKIISLILALCLVLSVSPLVLSENSETSNESIDVINALGISKETNPDLRITRADFSVMMANVIGYKTESISCFSDIPETYYAVSEISTLYNLKLVNGKEANMFYPEAEMTIEEAITVMLRFLGYDQLAEAKGGYPTGYTFLARDINLLKGVSFSLGETLTLKKAAQLFENLMEIEIFSIIAVKDDGTVSKQTVSGETVAKIYYNMDIITGIVKGNKHTSLNTPFSSDRDIVIIEDKMYKSENFNSAEYLGFSVKAYIQSETEQVVYLKKTNKNTSVIYDASQIDDVRNNRLYYNQERDYEEIPSIASIIYNKKAISTYKDEYFDIDKGSIELIDNNDDGDYDVVKILSYKNYVVDSVSGDGTVIRLKDNMGVLDFKNKYKDWILYDEEGTDTTVEMLNSNHVLTAIVNEENGFIEMTYLESVIRGSVTGLEIGEENIIFIDNEQYKMSKYFLDNQPHNVKTGISGMFFKDAFGEIVSYMPMGEDNRGFAYMLNIAEKQMMSNEISIRLFTQNNEERILESGKYLTVDGIRDIAKNFLSSLKPGGICTPQLIYYEANSKGLITLIDTITSDSITSDIEFKLLHNSVSGKDQYLSGSMAFEVDEGDDAVYLGSSCVVFTVPSPLTSNKDDYSAVDISELQNSQTYKYKAYARNTNGIEADVVALSDSADKEYDVYSYISLIEKITTVFTEEEEVVHKICYWYRGDYYESYTVDSEIAKNLHAGDCVYLSKDFNGKISHIQMNFEYNGKIPWGKDSDGKWSASSSPTAKRNKGHRFTYGEVANVFNSNLYAVSYVDANNETITELHRPATYIYHVTELPGGDIKVSVGSITDLKDSKSFSLNCSKVFTHQTYLTDYDLVIYNKQ